MSKRNAFTEIVADQQDIEMLDGISYRWFDFGQLPASTSRDYLIYIPDAPIDLFFYGRSFSGRASNLQLEIYAAPTFTAEGSSMQNRIFNRNADKPKNNQAQIWLGPTITDVGTLVDYDETSGSVDSNSGTKGSAGSDASQEFPRLMPKDTYILARVTNLSSSNPANFVYKLFWSEVT